MAAPARHLPQPLVDAFARAAENFALKRQTDREFNDFVLANEGRMREVMKIFGSCVENLKDLPLESRLVAKRVFSGPVHAIYSKPHENVDVEVEVTDDEPLSEEEFPDTLRDWAMRVTIYMTRFWTSAPRDQINNLLNSGPGVKVTFARSSTDRHHMGIVLQAPEN